MQSENINEIAAALAKVQGKLEGASKDAENPFFKTKYVDLTATWEACRGLLAANGLSVAQFGNVTPSGPVLTTLLMHSSGQWLSGDTPLVFLTEGRGNPMQGMGSAFTYARRYGLSAMVGVVAEDDDGNQAGRPQSHREQANGPRAKSDYPELQDWAKKIAALDIPEAFTDAITKLPADEALRHTVKRMLWVAAREKGLAWNDEAKAFEIPHPQVPS